MKTPKSLIEVITSVVVIVALLCIAAIHHSAKANNGDIDLIVKTGSGNVPAADLINTSGGGSPVATGTAITSGTGLLICPTGPIVSSTANLATTGTLPGTTGTSPLLGELAMSSSGTLLSYGTSGWGPANVAH
ncbi:MAG TPA: hypothetical protein VHY22_13455 [Chthoniobacteraceae bacterium]|jgi:hypothetical protein|nr:hypothetical protein [Chthoniobacteraceae bacterium]